MKNNNLFDDLFLASLGDNDFKKLEALLKAEKVRRLGRIFESGTVANSAYEDSDEVRRFVKVRLDVYNACEGDEMSFFTVERYVKDGELHPAEFHQIRKTYEHKKAILGGAKK